MANGHLVVFLNRSRFSTKMVICDGSSPSLMPCSEHVWVLRCPFQGCARKININVWEFIIAFVV